MNCIDICSRRTTDESHHPDCPLYKTEKRPRLFYFEEAENCWCPVPDRIDEVISAETLFCDGDTTEIEFKRVDMTDYELINLEGDE